MKLNQYELVESLLDYYRREDITPGDPNDGPWEDAHIGLPEALGGDYTVLLRKRDHQLQGLAQSEEFGRRYFFPGAVVEFLNHNWCNDWFGTWDLYESIPTQNQGKKLYINPDGDIKFYVEGEEPRGWKPHGATLGRRMFRSPTGKTKYFVSGEEPGGWVPYGSAQGKRMFQSPDGEIRWFVTGAEPEGWTPHWSGHGRRMFKSPEGETRYFPQDGAPLGWVSHSPTSGKAAFISPTGEVRYFSKESAPKGWTHYSSVRGKTSFRGPSGEIKCFVEGTEPEGWIHYNGMAGKTQCRHRLTGETAALTPDEMALDANWEKWSPNVNTRLYRHRTTGDLKRLTTKKASEDSGWEPWSPTKPFCISSTTGLVSRKEHVTRWLKNRGIDDTPVELPEELIPLMARGSKVGPINFAINKNIFNNYQLQNS